VPVVAGPLGLALLGAGIAVAFATVAALEAGGEVRLRGINFGEVRRGTLPLVVAAMALLMASGASVLYRGRVAAIRIAAEAQLWLAESLLATDQGVLFDPRDYRDPRRIDRAVERLVRSEPPRVALALRRTLEFPGAVSAVIGGATVLLVLDPVATAIGALFTLLALPLFYRVNVRAVHATKRTEALAANHAKAISALYRTLAPLPQASPASTHAAVAREPTVGALADAWRVRFQAVDGAQFISQVLAAAVFFALLWYFGNRILQGDEGLTTIALFVVILQFTLTYIRTLARLSATIARYYPSIFRVQHFLSTPTTTNREEPRQGWRWRTVPSTPGLSSSKVKVEPGSAVGISCEVVPHRFSAGFYVRLLQRGSPHGRQPRAPHVIPIATLDAPPFGMNLREVLGLPADARNASELGLGAATLASLQELDLNDLRRPIDRGQWRLLPLPARLELSLRAALLAHPDAIIGPPAVHAWWGEIDPQRRPLLLIWSKGRPAKGSPAAQHLVFATTGELVTHGPPNLIREDWGAIAPLLARQEAPLDDASVDDGSVDDEGSA